MRPQPSPTRCCPRVPIRGSRRSTASIITRIRWATASCCGAPTISPTLRKRRSEEHTSELQSLMRISYAVFCLKKKKQKTNIHTKIELKKVRQLIEIKHQSTQID